MDDLISRQAAIDAIQQHRVNVLGGYEYDESVAFVYAAAHNHIIDVVKRLPSAQPEIIRCRDCKHFEYNHPYIIQGVPVLGLEVCNAWGDGCKTDENGYCFLAERRGKT